MEGFINQYNDKFNSPQVIKTANKIFEAIKESIKLNNKEECMASIALACKMANDFYKNR